jgi:hypothetical protein
LLRLGVSQHDLAIGSKSTEYLRISAYELAFSVCNGQIKPFDTLQKHAPAWVGRHVYPAVLKLTAIIVGERCELRRLRPAVPSWQQPCFDQYLETVANADDKLSGVLKPLKVIRKTAAQLVCQDFSRSHIVTVRKAARQDEDLIIRQYRGGVHQCMDVYAGGMPTGRFKGIVRFLVAVCAWCSKHHYLDARHSHSLPTHWYLHKSAWKSFSM